MLGKIKGKRRELQRMRWLDSITDLIFDKSLSKLWEIVKDRDPGMLQSMGSQRVGHDLATEQRVCMSLGYICVCVWGMYMYVLRDVCGVEYAFVWSMCILSVCVCARMHVCISVWSGCVW